MNYTHFLGRTEIEETIKHILGNFQTIEKNTKRNIYLRGKSGVGKTSFVTRILEEMNYDIIHYDVNETKNNTTLDIITNNTSCNNIISSFKKEKRKHVVLIDDTDILSISEKTTLSTLIKLVRPKKTKKQQSEPCNNIPIVFVGNTHVDKKIKDLINVCHTFELKPPTKSQMDGIVKNLFPDISENETDFNELVDYVGEDLSKLSLVQEYYGENMDRLMTDLKTILVKKTKNSDRNQKVHQLYMEDIPLKSHSQFINETDRTTISLLWHENVVDILKSLNNISSNKLQEVEVHSMTPISSSKKNTNTSLTSVKKSKKVNTGSTQKSTFKKKSKESNTHPPPPHSSPSSEIEQLPIISYPLNKTLPIYVKMLDNICYSDYIDRITFQKQVWKLNEISSIIKTFKNNNILHKEILSTNKPYEKNILPKEIRFTKILTKYSSEYNNFWFIRNLCQTLGVDKNDLFNHLMKYPENHEQLLELFELNEFDLTALNRLIKYYTVYTTGVLPKSIADSNSCDMDFPTIEFDIEDVEDN